MLYDLLNEYKRHVVGTHQPATAQTYYKRLCSLFEGQSLFHTIEKLDIDKILGKLGEIKHKNYFSQSKNAFLHFCEFKGIKLSDKVLENIKELEQGTKKKYRKMKVTHYKSVDSKIKHSKNKKLKLSFQVMSATGLRVSELASLISANCTITADEITFSFIGKGGASEAVTLKKTDKPKLYENVKELIENTPPNKKIFYSAIYLQNKAKEMGFRPHDLRRAYAKLEYKKTGSKTHVRDKLRHSSVKTTNIYLRSKIKI